ncbi:MAG: hypothetical protein M9916_04025 [Crocinitomicaceae bacterium]|nr:hypothetical protein [Crocinitomicaceae bacterium]
MKWLVSIGIIFSFVHSLFAQLNRTETITELGEKKIVCYHQNGKQSTVETWESDNRLGKIVGYNADGKEIFYYNLRNIGGSAYVNVGYFENGQVKRVDYSDVPDAGIQFYKSKVTFDEVGNQVTSTVDKYPPEYVTIPQKPMNPPQKEVVICAIVFKNYFSIQNTIPVKIKVRVTDIQGNRPISSAVVYELKPMETLVFDTIITAQNPMNEKKYSLEMVSFAKKKKIKRVKITIPAKFPSTSDSKTWLWMIEKD